MQTGGESPVSAAPPPHSPKKVSLPALLAETVTVQALGTLSILIIPALAPSVAASLGVSTNQVGFQISIAYIAATCFSLAAGSIIAYVGACRTGQIAMAISGAGCLLNCFATIPTTIVGSLLIGLAYGLINPAASNLLIAHSPARHRSLIFSLKQTGVPIGGMAAGMIGPPVALAHDWTTVMAGIAVVCFAMALASQPGRAALDGGQRRSQHLRLFLLGPFRALLRDRGLSALGLASFCFSGVQLCVVGFAVALLVEDLGFGLVVAGTVLAAVQISGASGRLLWGAVADAAGDGLLVLIVVATIMVLASAMIAIFQTALPEWLLIVLLLILGVTAVGWNGVYLSEVARLSPPNEVGATTGAAMFLTFAGVVVAPTVFSLLHGVLSSYAEGYFFLAAISGLGGLLVARARSSRSRSPK